MPLDPRKYAVPEQYKGPVGVDPAFELRRIATALESIVDLLPQATDRPPERPRLGMVRLAVFPGWNPLGSGSNAWVQYNGSSWVAF